MSGAVYLLNDLSDKEEDRRHAVKRFRPIASGKVGVPVAAAAMAILAAAGLAAAFLIDYVLGGLCLLYLVINVFYSLGVKRLVLLDVFIVAAGYVIRTVAGAITIDVTPSPWLYSTTAAAALFIVLGRRYAEVRLAGEGAVDQRSVLAKYAGPFIGQLVIVSATAAWLSYTLYTVEAGNLPQNNTMLLTIPLVTFGLFRYLYLLNIRGGRGVAGATDYQGRTHGPLDSRLGGDRGVGADIEQLSRGYSIQAAQQSTRPRRKRQAPTSSDLSGPEHQGTDNENQPTE